MREPILICLLLVWLLTSCSPPSSSEKVHLSIYAAASLTEVVQELADSFQQVHPTVRIQTNWASSGTLVRQIQQGAPADIFISAHAQWTEFAMDHGLALKYQNIARNRLALIASNQTTAWPAPDLAGLEGILDPPKFAMGDPRHVPAGIYAQQALQYLGWYKTIEPMIIPTKDVRSALRLVELNEAPAGIVYQTDALKSKHTKILMKLPPGAHDPITYQIALIQENKVALAFYDYIRNSQQQSLWVKHGFTPFSE